MAYQNVGTPRFYINVLEWLASTGAIELESVGLSSGDTYQLNKLLRTLPVVPEAVSPEYQVINGSFDMLNNNFFVMALGHKLGTITASVLIADTSIDWIVNNSLYSGIDGFSIAIGDTNFPPSFTSELTFTFLGDLSSDTILIGSLIMGTYYDMPNAPNLSLMISREYGGTKEFTTQNGSSMSNTMWSKPPAWGDLGAWELDDGTSTSQALSRSGRRSWDLKFSYMDDGDLWGPNQMLSYVSPNTDAQNISIGYEVDDVFIIGVGVNEEGSANFNYNLLTDDNFFSQVWHKTLGGTLPFIFQPDNLNNNPDQFAICKFKDNSLKATQSAFNVYDVSVSIEEVW